MQVPVQGPLLVRNRRTRVCDASSQSDGIRASQVDDGDEYAGGEEGEQDEGDEGGVEGGDGDASIESE